MWLNSPLMTFTLCLSGSSGCRVLPSFISAPWPRAHQWLPLMPLPMNSTANRFGNVPAAVATMLPGTAVCAGFAHAIDSSHGSAIVTPRPRRTVRLEIVPLLMFTSARRALPRRVCFGTVSWRRCCQSGRRSDSRLSRAWRACCPPKYHQTTSGSGPAHTTAACATRC